METPCVKICVIDQSTRQCTGCLRTLEEIARWSSYSDAERRRIMNDLPARNRRQLQLEADERNGADMLGWLALFSVLLGVLFFYLVLGGAGLEHAAGWPVAAAVAFSLLALYAVATGGLRGARQAVCAACCPLLFFRCWARRPCMFCRAST